MPTLRRCPALGVSQPGQSPSVCRESGISEDATGEMRRRCPIAPYTDGGCFFISKTEGSIGFNAKWAEIEQARKRVDANRQG